MKADPKADAAAPKSSPKKLMIIIALGTLVLALGGGTAFFFMQGKDDSHAPKKSVKAEIPEYLQLEPFTVNLQPETGDQYLQIQFTLQVAGVPQAELIKANMPKVRSRVLLLLSGKKASEISTVEGKRQLADEIIASVKQPFSDKGEPQQVTDVLYTSFIIQ